MYKGVEKIERLWGGGKDHNKEWRPRSEFLSAGTVYKMLGHDHKVTHNAPRTSINAGSDIGHLVGSTKIHSRSLNQALTKIYGPAEVARSLTVCCQMEAVHKVSCTAGLWTTLACAVGLSTSCAEVRSFNIQRGEVKSGVRNNKKCPLQPLAVCIFLIFKGFFGSSVASFLFEPFVSQLTF